MTNELPEHILTLYPFLRKINNPILILEVTGMLAFLIALIPVYFRNKELSHKK